MIDLKTTGSEQKIDKAVEMFVGLILDAKDELKAASIDFIGARRVPFGDISVSFYIAKGNKRFGYTYTMSVMEIERMNPSLLPKFIISKAIKEIGKIKEQLIKNVK